MSIESHRINSRNWSKRNPAYNREWKQQNREKILAKRRPHYQEEWQKIRSSETQKRATKTALIYAAKNKPCMDCGSSYPHYVMHFDHRDPLTKRKNLSGMGTYSLDSIQSEIAKCDVVCANCHATRTHMAIQAGKIKIFGRYNVS